MGFLKEGVSRFAAVIRPIRHVSGIVVATFGLLAALPMTLLTITARTGSGRLAGWVASSALAAVVATIVPARSPTRDASRRSSCRTYPGEDHFLFFARRHEAFEAIARGSSADDRSIASAL